MARTTYIPQYFSMITVDNGNIIVNDSSMTRDLYYESNSKYSITVLQDEVTPERIKKIKRQKASEGWSAAAAILSGISSGLNPLNNAQDIRFYVESRETMYSAAMHSMISRIKAETLKCLDISIIIDNYSDEEITVNDMNRGLLWYIKPHSNLTLSAGTPEINDFRIANNSTSNKFINYVTVQTANCLSKFDIEYENEKCWVIPQYGDIYSDLYLSKEITGYKIIYKETMEFDIVSKKDWKTIQKEL